MKRWLALGLMGVLAVGFPQPEGYVNDFASMLSPGFQESLEKDLSDFEKETTAEICLVTIKTLGDDSIEDYSVRLFEEWKIGKKEKDNGILILIAKNEQKIRIEVGYGLEPIITDGRAGRIIREKIKPNFRKENYEEGVKLAVAQIEDYIRKGEPPKGREATQEKLADSLVWFFLGSLVLIYLTSFLGRTKEFITGGVIGGFLGGFFGWVVGGLVAIFGLAVVLGVIGFVLDYLFSKNYQKLKALGRPTGFWASRGGFSSGGFSGFGGGSSGGGGASGGW